MAKNDLFISYSRDDRAWAKELWRNLRDKSQRNPWIDEELKLASQWWTSILEAIENCDVCIFIMSPKSLESIYCQAEVMYALGLNKPILPIMLKECEIPAEISHFQYLDMTNSLPMADVLLRIERGLGEVYLQIQRGDYPARKIPRLPLPDPSDDIDAYEVMKMAEEALANRAFDEAKKLFTKVAFNSSKSLQEIANKRISDIERKKRYQIVKEMADNPQTVNGARDLLSAFIEDYGTEYDTGNLSEKLEPKTQKSTKPETTQTSAKPVVKNSDISAPITNNTPLPGIKEVIKVKNINLIFRRTYFLILLPMVISSLFIEFRSIESEFFSPTELKYCVFIYFLTILVGIWSIDFDTRFKNITIPSTIVLWYLFHTFVIDFPSDTMLLSFFSLTTLTLIGVSTIYTIKKFQNIEDSDSKGCFLILKSGAKAGWIVIYIIGFFLTTLNSGLLTIDNGEVVYLIKGEFTIVTSIYIGAISAGIAGYFSFKDNLKGFPKYLPHTFTTLSIIISIGLAYYFIVTPPLS